MFYFVRVIGAPTQLLPPLFGSPPNNVAAAPNLIPLAPKYPQIPAGPSFLPEGSAASTYQLLASNPLGSVPPYQLPLGIIPNGCGMQPVVVPGTCDAQMVLPARLFRLPHSDEFGYVCHYHGNSFVADRQKSMLF